MKINLCTEVVRELDFAGQCRFARELGYDGLEVAPFTLSDQPHRLSHGAIREFRSIADGEGIAVAGLHWLFAVPEGLSITATDPATKERSLDAGKSFVELCHRLGGNYIVHGSPAQRLLEPGKEEAGRRAGIAYFANIAPVAASAQVTYLLEPLSRETTGFITTIEQAVAIIAEIGSPGLATMIDCYATENNGEDIGALLQQWVPAGKIDHVHFNDVNRRGPGEGTTDFAKVLDILAQLDYSGTSAVEPFDYLPDGPACAARSIGYLRGLLARST